MITSIIYRSDPRDFSYDHPLLPGIGLSFDTLALEFVPGTTVAQANAVIQGIDADIAGGIPGTPGIYEGFLVLRLSTSTQEEMETKLLELRANPVVALAVQDTHLEPNVTTEPNDGNPAGWTWENPPAGANWNLERIRVPQMWNFNLALYKSDRRTKTVVLDRGFSDSHPDLPISQHGVLDATRDYHGLRVAGIIHAAIDNRRGIDGVNPFADLRLIEYSTPGSSIATGMSEYYDSVMSVFDAIINIFNIHIFYGPHHVVNMSLGYNWSHAGINTQFDTNAQLIAELQGTMFSDLLSWLRYTGSSPLLVVASGNDSNSGGNIFDQYAEYSSPMCNAAIAHGCEEIIVVEAVENAPGVGDGEVVRCYFSNLGGDVSAPGFDIWSLTGTAPYYSSGDGTSFAAPHVAGLAGYLMALDPDLTIYDIRDLIITNSIDINDAANRIDAWASAVDIDRITGGNDVLKMMCDVDDGTPDGNLRILYTEYRDYYEEDADGDGGIGDGLVDMSDFRRWRDWHLLTQSSIDLHLDGEAENSKRDVNYNGEIEDFIGENIYPRGDFNGDGILDLVAESYVPGALGRTATDLEVFMEIFSDADHASEDLPNLIYSADVHIDLTSYFSFSGLTSVNLKMMTYEGSLYSEWEISSAEPERVITEPLEESGYKFVLESADDNFEFGDTPFVLKTGEDLWLQPVLNVQLDPSATFLHVCSIDDALDATPFKLADLGIRPGDYIMIDEVGYFTAGVDYEHEQSMIALFSTSDILLEKDESHRVPGAIQAGDNYVTAPTWECDQEPTDIPEDFHISGATRIKVPEGAEYLFIVAGDVKYEDNFNDGNWGVQITRISAVE